MSQYVLRRIFHIPERWKILRIFVKKICIQNFESVNLRIWFCFISKTSRNELRKNPNSAHFYRSNEGFDKFVSHVKSSKTKSKFLRVWHWRWIANSPFDAAKLWQWFESHSLLHNGCRISLMTYQKQYLKVFIFFKYFHFRITLTFFYACNLCYDLR